MDLDEATRLPDEFSGRVRLFPLPGLVLFPHAMQPLHIFEPRYVEMLQEALAGDQLIAMATLVEDTLAAGGHPRPPIDPTICIGRVVSHSELEDDRHNVLLVGIRRARVRSEIDAGRSFRLADVDVLDDVYPASGATGRDALKGRLLDAFGRVIPSSEGVQKNLYELMAGAMPLGPITDIIGYMMPLSTRRKLRLLGTADVDRRAALLTADLTDSGIQIESMSVQQAKTSPPSGHEFPPPFSLN